MADKTKDPLEQLAEDLKAKKKRPKVDKSQATVKLSEPEWTIFRKYCISKDLAFGDMLDLLIKLFLDKVKDDLPK